MTPGAYSTSSDVNAFEKRFWAMEMEMAPPRELKNMMIASIIIKKISTHPNKTGKVLTSNR